MKQKIRVNIFPKEGHSFTEKDGTILNANDWNSVIRAVRNYRRRNGLPAGMPADEVHEQTCARNPSICYNAKDETTVKELKRASLQGRVLRWFSELIRHREKNPINFVSDEEARAREDVCQKCQFNTTLPSEGCGPCKKAIREQRRNIIGGRPEYKRLNTCSVLGEDLQASVHIDLPVVDSSELPQHCWRKQR